MRKVRGLDGPDVVCECGHRRDAHGEFLPAPCSYGAGPKPVLSPDEFFSDAGLEKVSAWCAAGCQCNGFRAGQRGVVVLARRRGR
jgi:hypothetical protein